MRSIHVEENFGNENFRNWQGVFENMSRIEEKSSRSTSDLLDAPL